MLVYLHRKGGARVLEVPEILALLPKGVTCRLVPLLDIPDSSSADLRALEAAGFYVEVTSKLHTEAAVIVDRWPDEASAGPAAHAIRGADVTLMRDDPSDQGPGDPIERFKWGSPGA